MQLKDFVSSVLHDARVLVLIKQFPNVSARNNVTTLSTSTMAETICLHSWSVVYPIPVTA